MKNNYNNNKINHTFNISFSAKKKIKCDKKNLKKQDNS